MHIKETEADVE